MSSSKDPGPFVTSLHTYDDGILKHQNRNHGNPYLEACNNKDRQLVVNITAFKLHNDTISSLKEQVLTVIYQFINNTKR